MEDCKDSMNEYEDLLDEKDDLLKESVNLNEAKGNKTFYITARGVNATSIVVWVQE